MKTFKLLSFTIILFSCNTTRYTYTASPPNNPYFTEKKQSKVAAYYSSSAKHMLSTNFANGFDTQAAYAITNHWAITSAFFYQKEKDIYNYYSSNNKPFDSSLVNYKRNLFDFGGGYFLNLNDNKTITFNLLGSISLGKFSFNDNGIDVSGANYSRYHSSNITRWFFQPSINFIPSDVIKLSLILKPTFVHYGNIKTSYTQEELDYFQLSKISNRTKGFFEFSSNIQLCIPEYSWINLDLLFSRVGEYTDLKPGTVRKFNMAIGLCFDFSKLKKNN